MNLGAAGWKAQTNQLATAAPKEMSSRAGALVLWLWEETVPKVVG